MINVDNQVELKIFFGRRHIKMTCFGIYENNYIPL